MGVGIQSIPTSFDVGILDYTDPYFMFNDNYVSMASYRVGEGELCHFGKCYITESYIGGRHAEFFYD